MYPIEVKEAILEDAKQRILDGETIAKVASVHGISSRTLATWLHGLGDEYKELREIWIDNMLLEASDAIDSVTDESDGESDIQRANLHLAQAREKWKKATWYAERRDSQRYGQKTEHKQDLSLSITVNRAIETQVIEHECVTLALPKKEKS